MIETLDEKFGRRWICERVVDAMGGDWPLETGWRKELIGNAVTVSESAFDKLVLSECDNGKHLDHDDKTERPKKYKTKLKVVKATHNPVDLTDEQEAAVIGIIELKKKTQSLGGLAGTGKSTVVSHLMQRLNGFACCAFTGKAADVLRSKGVDATTIHSLIYYPTGEKDKDGMPVFIKKSKLDCSGIIVDEASMVSSSLYRDLQSFGLPIIFVGDHGQLEPVGEDQNLLRNPDYRLETVHRNAGDIAFFAHHLRDGHSAADFPSSSIIKIIQKKDCVPHLLDSDQIICAKNNTRVAINRYVRELQGNKDTTPQKDDRVISLMNSKKLGIYNGSQGVIRSVSPMKMSVAFDSGKLVKVKYDQATFNSERPVKDIIGVHPLDYAYAVTAHKSQGSEWRKVMVIEQICSLWDHKRWAYTAASRAREELVWVLPCA